MSSEPELRPVEILVVDDSPLDRHLVTQLLNQGRPRFHVDHAENGEQALERIAARPPDLVITDLHMPVMDGLSLVQAIRKRHPLTPSIVMTAFGSENVAIEALKRGAASYVPKRNLAERLVHTVQEVLAVAHTDRQQLRLSEYWEQSEFQFCLENDSSLVPILVRHIQRYLADLHVCDETEVVRVGVALHEALYNAIHHGNLELDSELRDGSDTYYELADQRRWMEPYRSRRVWLVARESRETGHYVVRDDGRGFDPQATVRKLDDPSQLTRLWGRGFILIYSIMDEVRFNDRGNEITLIHHRRPGNLET